MTTYPFTEQEYVLLLQTILQTPSLMCERDLILVRFCAELGLRIQEALQARITDINHMNQTLTIPAAHSKNGRQRVVYIHTELYKVIQAYLLRYQWFFQKDYFFWSREKEAVHLSYSQFHHRWKAYMSRAGFFEVNFVRKNGMPFYKKRIHDLRAYFCCKVREANPTMPLSKLKFVTGHASEYTLEHFYVDKGVVPLEVCKAGVIAAFG